MKKFIQILTMIACVDLIDISGKAQMLYTAKEYDNEFYDLMKEEIDDLPFLCRVRGKMITGMASGIEKLYESI